MNNEVFVEEKRVKKAFNKTIYFDLVFIIVSNLSSENNEIWTTTVFLNPSLIVWEIIILKIHFPHLETHELACTILLISNLYFNSKKGSILHSFGLGKKKCIYVSYNTGCHEHPRRTLYAHVELIKRNKILSFLKTIYSFVCETF